MNAQWLYLLAADAILVTHVLFVAFVVVGLALILIGKHLDWAWICNFRFRVLHLAAIAYVVMQSWLGAICPLTVWEMELRHLAGDSTYQGAFIAYWLHEMLYFTAPDWLFIVVYSLFGLLVLASWFWVRPRR